MNPIPTDNHTGTDEFPEREMTPSSATGLDEKALEAAAEALADFYRGPYPESEPFHAISRKAITAYMSALEGAVASEPYKWEGYWPGAGSIDSITRHTSHKPTAEKWEADGAEVTPLFTHPAPVAAQPAEGWVTCETCQGNGEIVTDWERYNTLHEGDKGDEAVIECPDCNGTGHVTPPTAPAVPAGVREALVDSIKQLDVIIEDGIPTDYRAWRDDLKAALSALPAQPNSSERQKALEEALKLSRETLMMVRDCFGRDMTQPFRERVDDSINAGSAALGYVAKPLATNQPNSSEGEG